MPNSERRAPARQSCPALDHTAVREKSDTVPRHELPEAEMAPDVAYQVIHDELMLDGNARRTWRPSSAPRWSRRPRG